MSRLWLAILLLLVVACSSDDGGGSTKPKPKTTPTLSFEAAPVPGGASLSLRAKSLSADQLVLEIVGKGLTDVYGVAFRMKYDPAVLEPVSIAASTAWQGQTSALVNAKTPGLLVAVLTEQGKTKGIGASDTVLGTLTLSLKQAKPTTLSFVVERARVVDSKGTSPSAVQWAAGALVEH